LEKPFLITKSSKEMDRARMIGKIYKEKGWKAKAIEHYERFLGLWKDTDPGVAEFEDAKKRVTGLRDSSLTYRQKSLKLLDDVLRIGRNKLWPKKNLKISVWIN
jgi:hypothetical protein